MTSSYDENDSFQVPTVASEGHCIWYGVCTEKPKSKNCAYEGPAKPIDNASLVSDYPTLNNSYIYSFEEIANYKTRYKRLFNGFCGI